MRAFYEILHAEPADARAFDTFIAVTGVAGIVRDR